MAEKRLLRRLRNGEINMLIRSQDKKVLFNYSSGVVKMCENYEHKIINHTLVSVETGEYNIFLFCNGEEYLIGMYSTEEKAIKVLNMIQNAYFIMEYSKFRGNTKEDFVNPIFEMPKDEEVK